MSDKRNGVPTHEAHSHDPYAELVAILDPSASGRNGYGFEEEQAELRYDAADPTSGDARRSRPKAPRRFFDEDETSGTSLALMGLSEPATPRIAGPAETGHFAPERYHPEPVTAAPLSRLDDFDELIASELAVMRGSEPVTEEYDAHPDDDWGTPEDGRYRGDGHDPSFDHMGERVTVPHAIAATRRRAKVPAGNSRRALFFAGGVAAVALVGVFGVFAGGGIMAGVAGGGEPILIRADNEPFKIAPTDPGGRVVPNQNTAVYQRVARDGAVVAPEQEMLISASETPLDISFEDEVSALPGVMVGAPDFPETAPTEVAQAAAPATGGNVSGILQPHRVRTYDVRPDGTLVPREDDAAAPAGVTGAPADPASVPAAVQPVVPFSTELPAEVSTTEPAAAPAAPSEPPAETAAVAPPAPAPAGAFFVQISSQPSEALAQDSMQTLSGRYASAIGGRPLSIQPAEIEGRGTFYRVRVAAQSREEANTVCESVQSAGGSCFVTR